MSKSADAFRTISEVADWLGVHAHVLRFWESKFTQIKPVKRAGGRRYYRPVDMLLLGGIQKLLHEDGLTIKGVQKILREKGMAHVSALSKGLDDMDADGPKTTGSDETSRASVTPIASPNMDKPAPEAPSAMDVPQADPDEANVVNFMSGDTSDMSDDDKTQAAQRPSFTEDAVVMPDPKPAAPDVVEPTPPQPAAPPLDDIQTPEPVQAEPEPQTETLPEPSDPVPEAPKNETAQADLTPAPQPVDAEPEGQTVSEEAPEPVVQNTVEVEPEVEVAALDLDAAEEPEAEPEPEPETIPVFMSASAKTAAEDEPQVAEQADEHVESTDDDAPAAPVLPSFLHRRAPEVDLVPDAPEPEAAEPVEAASSDAPQATSAEPDTPKPQIIDVPETPDEASFDAAPKLLSTLSKTKTLSAAQAKDITPLLAQLVGLRDRMVQARKE
ncbi:MerR family transcriptional regulator [Pseudosulfitobacter sp. SM2401]|uniref:MerR family transcriptional regulator n=1 Tax=Pseudosulfitobacter sp. SM2401 TaxID=3350098 RepID=UPI0036F1ED0B